jgi:hypothetical protein
VRQAVVAATMLLLLGGCGGGGRTPTAARSPAPTAAPAAKRQGPIGSGAPVLVRFTQQRPGALIDNITVHTDGYGLFDRPSGGVGRVLRDVVVEPAVLRRVRRDMAELPREVGKGDGSPAVNGATYILRYHGRTFVARQGDEPEALREPMRLLAGTLVGDGIRKVTRERLGGVAGATHLSGIGEERRAPALVFFQRQGAAGATLDTFTVRRDGTARLEKRYGGAGGRFKDLVLRHGELPKLRAALAALPPGSTLTRGSPPPGGATYLLRYRGRTQTARQGAIVQAARPAVKLLDGFIDGIGVRRTTRETATNDP